MVEIPQKTVEGFAIELYFDEKMEAQIRAFREMVYQSGVEPILGKLGDRPHVSLAVFPKIDPNHLQEVTRVFSSRIQPFPVLLSALGTFPTPDNVLFLTPVPSEPLLRIHSEFHALLKKEKLLSSSYYHPGTWIPHCTLEFNLSETQFALAIQAGKTLFKPIKGSFTEIGLVSFRPICYLAEYPLIKKEK
jgi:2'-5' RNA ligase